MEEDVESGGLERSPDMDLIILLNSLKRGDRLTVRTRISSIWGYRARASFQTGSKL